MELDEEYTARVQADGAAVLARIDVACACLPGSG